MTGKGLLAGFDGLVVEPNYFIRFGSGSLRPYAGNNRVD